MRGLRRLGPYPPSVFALLSQALLEDKKFYADLSANCATKDRSCWAGIPKSKFGVIRHAASGGGMQDGR